MKVKHKPGCEMRHTDEDVNINIKPSQCQWCGARPRRHSSMAKKKAVKMSCPMCGHEIIDPRSIGLTFGKSGDLYCPMNMPYQGCGWLGVPK